MTIIGFSPQKNVILVFDSKNIFAEFMNNYQEELEKYIKEIQSIDATKATEHSYRTSLEVLLKSIKFKGTDDIVALHEGRDKNYNIDGTPDFIIYKNPTGLFSELIGFVECKKIDYDLEKVKTSAQIGKYTNTIDNIIITNYREFILLNKGKETAKVQLLDKNFQESKDKNISQQFINLLRQFYNYEYQYIKTRNTLAKSLAAQSFYFSVALRQYIEDTTQSHERYYKKFFTLFSDFQSSIQYHYVLEDFCDVYSQTLVYCLFIARLEKDVKINEELINLRDIFSDSSELLFEFIDSGYTGVHIPPHIEQAFTSIGRNINYINVPAIQEEFQKISNNKSDISVYLYEDFLREYDIFRQTEKRKESGVYYTPKEATDFITNAVNDLIISEFDLQDGFMSENVKILDFATGTGTFIKSIFDIIFEKNYSKKLDDLDKKKIKDKIMNDIYGFELLFPPYIVAHLMLKNYLKSKEISFEKYEQLKIYLTNTLDIGQHSISGHLPTMQEEHEEAFKIKSKQNILAIVGNPPYFNGKSQSISGVIEDELVKYKEGLNERKINLNDMYVKFIRFAEWKMEQAGQGIVGIVTNNGFLDGLTFRQMRKHLCETFDEIYIVNLHGNSRKGEKDKNIFDIMVGVCICIFVKHKNSANSATVGAGSACPETVETHNYASLQKGEQTSPLQKNKTVVKYFSTVDNGILSRKDKLEFLQNAKFRKIKWKILKTTKTENYWFVPKDFSLQKQYKKFWKITDIFEKYNSGIQTKNDSFTIQYSQKTLERLQKNILKLNEKEISEKYNIKGSRDWTVEKAKEDLINNYNPQKISFRPLDIRWTSLSTVSKGFLGYPRYEIMKHFENYKNFGLCFTRTVPSASYDNVFITNKIIDIHYCSDQVYIAPLYLYNGNGNGNGDYKYELLAEGIKRRTNFTKQFNEKYLDKLNFKKPPTPERILAYIYAVMHSPIYREKYIEFLKTDFPAVPMTSNETVFEKFAKLGQQLIDFHLLEKIPKDYDITFNGDISKSVIIGKIIPPTVSDNVLKLLTVDNQKITFVNVSPEIYNFEIGSYKPLEKWLKYRIKDKIELTVEDFTHIKNMLIALKNTIRIMGEIEALGEVYLEEEE